MESKLTNSDVSDENRSEPEPVVAPSSAYKISAHPVVGTTNDSSEREPLPSPLPHSYGTETLTLLVRDPQTIFAFWDIDWQSAFRDLEPKTERKIHLRLLDASGVEQSLTKVESMAGNCLINVPRAASAYRGEIGHYDVRDVWNCVAKSEVVMTPPETFDESADADFVTVPFHLSFQRMVDLLQETKEKNLTLTALLSELRDRVKDSNRDTGLTTAQRELGSAMENHWKNAEKSGALRPRDSQVDRKLERSLRCESSSPPHGFGGSSQSR